MEQWVGRNGAPQPDFANLDIRFVKDITLRGEGHHLDLFLDVFNVTGAQNLNFGPDAVSFFGTSADPVFSSAHPLFAPRHQPFRQRPSDPVHSPHRGFLALNVPVRSGG
jgi:hypothetical protein